MLLDTIHRTKTNKIHNTNIENRQDNQEWAAVNIGSNVYSCPFLVVLSVFYVCVVYFVFLRSVYYIQCLQLPIQNTNIENRRNNQEWAAVIIGYNTQNEDKQNTQHKHIKPTGQPGMGSCKRIVSNVYSCPFLVVPSVFYVCVLYFVCLRSVYCIQCLQLTIPGCPVSKHWIQYTERRQTKYTTQT
jgi:hypothetical protein